jgi:hypothetical protein
VAWFGGDHWSPPFGEVWSQGDVLGFAVDFKNRAMHFGHNGKWSIVFGDYMSKCCEEDSLDEIDPHLFPTLSMSTTGVCCIFVARTNLC